jgi:hypothetical protein
MYPDIYMQLAQRLRNLEAVDFDQVAVERRNRSNDLLAHPRNNNIDT